MSDMQNNSGTNDDFSAENQPSTTDQSLSGMDGTELENISPEEIKALREQAAKAKVITTVILIL